VKTIYTVLDFFFGKEIELALDKKNNKFIRFIMKVLLFSMYYIGLLYLLVTGTLYLNGKIVFGVLMLMLALVILISVPLYYFEKRKLFNKQEEIKV
jgi:hypothetical protein